MADFYTILRDAIGEAGSQDSDSRHVLYSRARAALQAQIDGLAEPLSGEQRAAQLAQLDEAVRRLEDDYAQGEKAGEDAGKDTGEDAGEPVAAKADRPAPLTAEKPGAEAARRWIARGVSFVAISEDTRVVGQAYRELVASVRDGS